MRERFDAGTGLVAVGAVLLLVSLFIDWYDPGWRRLGGLREPRPRPGGRLGVRVGGRRAPRFGSGGLGRALPIISGVRVRRRGRAAHRPAPDRQRLRPRHRRLARPRRHRDDGRRRDPRRREHLGHRRRARARAAAAHGRHRRARERGRGGRAGRGGRGRGARPRRFGRREEPLFEPREPQVAEPEEDPQRTQALDPVEPTKE